MNPTFDTLQQVMSLNFLSNAVSSVIDTYDALQTLARQRIGDTLADNTVQAMIGQWDLVWGPVIFSNSADPSQPDKKVVVDNLMFVAQRNDSQDYVVATAGTNPISWFGWFVEDFSVRETVPWPYGTAPAGLEPRISKGTAVGVNILWTMQDQGLTVQDFLEQQVAQASGTMNVTVTGHSLGGALSAGTALALFDTQATWNPDGKAVVAAVPSAGATLGDADFATYYSQQLGLRTNRIWNSLDIVPHAWNLSLLAQASNLYSPFLAPNLLINGFVALASSAAAGNGYTQINAEMPGLPSQVNLDMVFAPTPLSSLLLDLVQDTVTGILKKHLSGITLDIAEAYVKAVIAKLKQKWGEAAFDVPQSEITARMQQENTAADLSTLGAGSLRVGETSFPNINDFLAWLQQQFSGLLSFLGQAGYQHVTVYFYSLGIQELVARMTQIEQES
ncbi:Lipase-3 domain-containing protein [Sulfidibacter corallicola]|uniref:Fungal lipase-type domain-containing protein n=1 Tax=Sulfidibacter corallicola TaxID=2818388 RepID=A0A8A4TH41_SULCO|nr:lipase family protein [Sulfidibacter corallicola]QTD48837.1 hypothetical protein J3U87_24915 [Sulfidibacter corallicola]